jgi:hypothetical protein
VAHRDHHVRALDLADHDHLPELHRGHAVPDHRSDHPADRSSAWASWRDLAAACRAYLTGLPARARGPMVGEVHQAGPDLQRRVEVRVAGPCPEKTRTGCCPGVAPRCDDQPVPEHRAIRRSNQAVGGVRPVTHRHHPGEASASGGSGLGRPGAWFGRQPATGLLAVRRDRAVHPCGRGVPDLAEGPEATASGRSAAPLTGWQSNRHPGPRRAPPPWRRRSLLLHRWCQRREPEFWRPASSLASLPAAARSRAFL